MNFHEELLKIKNIIGFKKFTNIQNQSFKPLLQGKSIVAMSKTGSGKTHAFLFPIFNNVKHLNSCQTVIIAPTKDLASQIFRMASTMNKNLTVPVDIRLYLGSTTKSMEISKLSTQPDVVIATPGRLRDLVCKEKKLFVHKCKLLVVDEADMVFMDDYLECIDEVAGLMPKTLQMAIFSATIPKGLHQFLNKYMVKPLYIKENDSDNHAKIKHFLIKSPANKFNSLLNLTKLFHAYFMIIFVNTKEEVVPLATNLKKSGLDVHTLFSDMSLRVRRKVLKQIDEGKIQYLVATDIAARGMDFKNVTHVVNFDIPQNYEYYIHRTGRTARQEKDGIAISFYTNSDLDTLKKISNLGISFQKFESF